MASAVMPLTLRTPVLCLSMVPPRADLSPYRWNLGVFRRSTAKYLTRSRSHATSEPIDRDGWNRCVLRKTSAKSLTRLRCHASTEPIDRDDKLVWTENGLAILDCDVKLCEIGDGDHKIPVTKAILSMVGEVKVMLQSMADGEISCSAYDTAWVALVHQLDGKGGPQFPSSLEWIKNNQNPDGTWGDDFFSAHDRIINTLACIIALKTWNLCPEKWEKGLVYLCKNMWRIGDEDTTHMPIGFEIAFPSLMDRAQGLGLELPYDDPALQGIYTRRNLKLQNIPTEILHEVPTTLLHTLEGFVHLDWEKLLKLQCADGSFLFSPAATASALEHTGDKKCFYYLERIANKFNGGVPNVYPVDLFEHIWAVDRLERLGIARHFEPEIRGCMAYVNRYWTEAGICWARNSMVQDVDDTAMGFRLLRLHGYHVSPGVFRNFEKDNEFVCFVGQSDQAITGIYNLNRASQVMFPGEEILGRAKRFTYRFLREKQACNQLTDKWIIAKDLASEVKYGLEFPWYSSLPRVEARMYLQQYGGGGDVWIGKTFYRMFYVNNDLYLELAKMDYKQCQAVHKMEWIGLKSWYKESGLESHGVSEKTVLKAYFLAAACIYEPGREAERLGWAKSAVLADAISSYLSHDEDLEEKWKDFLCDFLNGNCSRKEKPGRASKVAALLQFINRQTSDDLHRYHLMQAWDEWLIRLSMGRIDTALLLVRTIEVCGGRFGSTDPLANLEYYRLSKKTSSICYRFSYHAMKINEESNGINTDDDLDLEMQELVQCALHRSDGLSNLSKQTFLHVTKSYYYAAHCPADVLEKHINMVLFEQVI